MTGEPKAPTLDEYWEKLELQLRSLSPDEQRAAIMLYRELAKGKPVDADQLARALGCSATESRALLQRDSLKWAIYGDKKGRVLGFGGLATAPMHHRFEVDGRSLWTWCAWDSLFIPGILGRSARVTWPDPETREIVRFVVTPDRVESVVPDGTVVSFIQPEAEIFRTSAANVMANFCHFVYFCASRTSDERWIAKNPSTFLYTLEQAFSLAKRLNIKTLGHNWRRPA